MGAWGVDSFDNDTACDWAYGLEEAEDLTPAREAIRAVVSATDYLDADIACEAIAAAEVVARLQGNFGKRDAYTEVVDKWVADHPQPAPAELVQMADDALARVLADESELNDLWSDNEEDYLAWKNSIEDLRTRVRR